MGAIANAVGAEVRTLAKERPAFALLGIGVLGDLWDDQLWRGERNKPVCFDHTTMGLYNVQDAEPLTTWLVKNLDAMYVCPYPLQCD